MIVPALQEGQASKRAKLLEEDSPTRRFGFERANQVHLFLFELFFARIHP